MICLGFFFVSIALEELKIAIQSRTNIQEKLIRPQNSEAEQP